MCDIKFFTVPGTQYVPCDAIILSDSIGQHIGSKVIRTECEFFGGCKVKGLIRKLKDREINISGYKCIVLIIGTCDISDKEVWYAFRRSGKLPEHTPKPILEIETDYIKLLETISNINSSASILITSIIPRPYDFVYNREYLKELNKKIAGTIKIDPAKYKFLNTAKNFIHCGEIKENLFDNDKIHLSPEGNRVLTDLLNGRIGQLIRK